MMAAAATEKNKIVIENISFKQLLMLEDTSPTKTQVILLPSSSNSESISISIKL